MSISVPSTDGGSVEVSAAAFGLEFNETLVHQAVVAYLAGGRQGTKAQKSRADVRGGGRKPWRQKRTGRARAGSIRSPLWRGGGRTFAPRPADHSQKLNRKMYRGAIRCIFSELIRQDRLLALPALSLKAPKTKILAAKLQELGVLPKKRTPASILVITTAADRNLQLAVRNLPDVDVHTVGALDPVSLIGRRKVLATVEALKRIEERLA